MWSLITLKYLLFSFIFFSYFLVPFSLYVIYRFCRGIYTPNRSQYQRPVLNFYSTLSNSILKQKLTPVYEFIIPTRTTQALLQYGLINLLLLLFIYPLLFSALNTHNPLFIVTVMVWFKVILVFLFIIPPFHKLVSIVYYYLLMEVLQLLTHDWIYHFSYKKCNRLEVPTPRDIWSMYTLGRVRWWVYNDCNTFNRTLIVDKFTHMWQNFTYNLDVGHDIIKHSLVFKTVTVSLYLSYGLNSLSGLDSWNLNSVWLKRSGDPHLTYYGRLKTFTYFIIHLVSRGILNLYSGLLRLWSYRSQLLLFIIVTLSLDALGSDEEPLWEPIEWSMIQTWILFIFIFAWFAEGLVLSRYGGYTGRDKRVWYSLYKTYWLLEVYYILSLGAAIICVIIPFYYEVNYEIAHIFSWWHWYSRLFFAHTMIIFTLLTLLLQFIQVGLRWVFWKKILLTVFIINIILTYLLYTYFILTCFSYFTDPVWFHRNRTVDFIQLSHEPAKWGWGASRRDHFTYHNTKTSFWFKSDGPYASAMIFIHFAILFSLFLLYVLWLVLFRRIYATSEVPTSFTIYCISALRQFFYLFYFIYFLVGFSFLVTYLRSPWSDYNLSLLITDTTSLYNIASHYILEYYNTIGVIYLPNKLDELLSYVATQYLYSTLRAVHLITRVLFLIYLVSVRRQIMLRIRHILHFYRKPMIKFILFYLYVTWLLW